MTIISQLSKAVPSLSGRSQKKTLLNRLSDLEDQVSSFKDTVLENIQDNIHEGQDFINSGIHNLLDTKESPLDKLPVGQAVDKLPSGLQKLLPKKIREKARPQNKLFALLSTLGIDTAVLSKLLGKKFIRYTLIFGVLSFVIFFFIGLSRKRKEEAQQLAAQKPNNQLASLNNSKIAAPQN